MAAALAVCAALGWWNGGSPWLAVAAILFGWYAAAMPVGPGPGAYRVLVHGWTLLLAASFGLTSLLAPGEKFLPRALSALGIAAVVAFGVAIATPDGIDSVRVTARTEFTRRTDSTIAVAREVTASPPWQWISKVNPGVDSMMTANEAGLRELPRQATRTVPAVVALESLIALALAWMIYHRVTETELGPRLGAVKTFRFNDQLIWGLAVGATIFFLPVFMEGRDAGLNLLVFFGALYLFRGVGVLSFLTRGKWAATLLIIMTIFAPYLLCAVALGVGVGDTWMDWRNRAQEKT